MLTQPAMQRTSAKLEAVEAAVALVLRSVALDCADVARRSTTALMTASDCKSMANIPFMVGGDAELLLKCGNE